MRAQHVAQFREPTIAMQAQRSQRRAAGHLTTLAPMAAAARDDRVNRNPLPRPGPGDASTDRYYHAGEFVSEDERRSRSNERVRHGRRDEHRPAEPFLKISTADTAPSHLKLQLTRSRRRRRGHLLHPHVTSSVPPYGQHLSRPPSGHGRRATSALALVCALLDIVSIFNKVKREYMTSMTRQYSSAASRARSAVDKTADFWTQGAPDPD